MSIMAGRDACDGIGAIVLEAGKPKGKDKKSGCTRIPDQKRSGKATSRKIREQAKAMKMRKDVKDARRECSKLRQQIKRMKKQSLEMKTRFKTKRAKLTAHNRELRENLKRRRRRQSTQVRMAFQKLHQTLVGVSAEILE